MFLALTTVQLLTYITLELLTKSTTLHFLDFNQAFCGSTLAEEMHKLCLTYNLAPPNFAINNHLHKGVVEECCKNKCSRRYLMENYCNHSKSLDELEKIYGEPFRKNYTIVAPPKIIDYQEQPKDDGFRKKVVLHRLHVGIRRKGKVPRSASMKKNKCSCRQRKYKMKKILASPANVGTKNRNTFYNWVNAPHFG